MLDFLHEIVKETLDCGIGAAIIAFGAWGYSLILILVVIYYIVLSIIKFFILRE